MECNVAKCEVTFDATIGKEYLDDWRLKGVCAQRDLDAPARESLIVSMHVLQAIRKTNGTLVFIVRRINLQG